MQLVYQSTSWEKRAWLLYYNCLPDVFVSVSVMWLFLTILWVGLQCVIVVYPDDIRLLFSTI